MTKEEKELLLKDLAARLPYGVVVEYNLPENIDGVNENGFYKLSSIDFSRQTVNYYDSSVNTIEIEKIKLYLRPMTQMTNEELDEFLNSENVDFDFDGKSGLVKRAVLEYIEGNRIISNVLFSMQYAKSIDWLNAHHFDYRGLIEKGLALKAPEGMYNFEKC